MKYSTFAEQIKSGSKIVEQMARFSDFLDNADFEELHELDQRRMQWLVRELQRQLKKFEFISGEEEEEVLKLPEFKDLV